MKYLIIAIFLFLPFQSYSQKWDEVNTLAIEAHNNGEYEKAQKYYEQGLVLAKKEYGSKSSYYSTALHNYALLLSDMDNFTRAETLFLESVQIRKVVYGEDHPKYGYVLNSLASCYQRMGKYDLSEKYYLQSIRIDSVALGTQNNSYATDMSNIGLLYQLMGKYDKAEVCLIKSVEIRKVVAGTLDHGYATSLSNLALLYLELGKYEKSEKMFLEVYEIDKELLGEKHPDCATDLINLAALYSEMGEMIKAEKFYLEGMEILKTSIGEMSQQYASSLNNLAMLYNDVGQFERAEEMYLECSKIGEEVWGNGHPEYASCINNLANLYQDMGRMDEAEDLFMQAARIRKISLGEDHPDYASSLNSLAINYYDRGRYDKAEKFYLAAIEIFINNYGQSHPMVGNILMNLALLYTVTNQLDKVEDYYLISSDIIRESSGENSYAYAGSVWGLARMYRVLGKYPESEKYFLKADSLFKINLGIDHPDYPKVVHGLAILNYQMGDTMAAGKLYELGDSLFLRHLQKLFRFTTEDQKTRGLFSVKNYFQNSHSYYWTTFKKNKNSPIAALNLHLATNGLVLSSVIGWRARIFSEGGDSTQMLYSEWEKYSNLVARELSKPTSARSDKLSFWQTEAITLERQLNKLSNTFQSSSVSLFPDFLTLHKSLKKDEAAVEFISFEYRDGIAGNDPIEYAAIVVTPEHPTPIYVPLFNESQLTGLLIGDSLRTFANLLYTQSTVRGIDHDISYGDSLYQLIWKPIEQLVNGKTSIYYSASGLLHTLNFDAIPCNSTQVLSDVFSMSRTTTTAVLINRKDEVFKIESIALYGGIQYAMDKDELMRLPKNGDKNSNKNTYSQIHSLGDSTIRSGFNYLPGSKTEVESISGLTEKNKIHTALFTGLSGSEESVKQLNGSNSPSIIHFSTHGFFIPSNIDQGTNNLNSSDEEIVFTSADNPLFRSGLVFAGADHVWKGNPPVEGVEDGILTAYEVSNMNLTHTKLVVMSACETGLGEINGTEGVYGLQRAFKMAGVDYIIMTLWQVLDKETSDFMTLFYQNLLDKRSIPEAFKTTQDTMKNKYRDEPYKWAGFVLIK